MRPASRLAIAILLAVAPLDAAAIRTGDVLAVDQLNDRILRIDPGTGAVQTFSPRSGPNLLAMPRAIGVDPDGGGIFVLNQAGSLQLVFIDPATGSQYALQEASPGSLVLGPDSTGLALSPRPTSVFYLPTLYVSGAGSVFDVTGRIVAATASSVASFPSAYQFDVGNFVALRDPGGLDPLDVFVATSQAILLYDGSTMSEYWTPGVVTIEGLRYAPLDSQGNGDTLYFSYQTQGCPSDYGGLFTFDLKGGLGAQTGFPPPVQTGGNVGCPGAIALSPDQSNLVIPVPPFPIFVVDMAHNPERIVAVTEPGVNHVVTILPQLSNAVDLAVYTPEPEAGGLAATAAVALLGVLGRRRVRGGGRRTTIPRSLD
jgi:hypothetical protein